MNKLVDTNGLPISHQDDIDYVVDADEHAGHTDFCVRRDAWIVSDQETAHLLKSPANARRLLESLQRSIANDQDDAAAPVAELLARACIAGEEAAVGASSDPGTAYREAADRVVQEGMSVLTDFLGEGSE